MNKNNILLLIIILILVVLCYKKNKYEFFITYNKIKADAYVINLDKSKYRFKSFIKKMNYEKLKINRFKAINGDEIDENIIKQVNKNCKKYYKLGLRKWKGCLSKSQLGCYLSHINLWKKVKLNKNLLIFEDDIIFTNNFIKKFNEIFNELPEDWDILLIGWWRQPFKFKKKYLENKDISKHLQKTNYPFLGMHGYLINYSFVKKMRKYMNINHIYNPIDNLLSDNIPNLNMYNTKKQLINQDIKNFKSTINIGFHLKKNSNLNNLKLL